MSPSFFTALKSWSYYKHTILSKYLRVWANKLGRYHPNLYFVDTHAGAGAYDSGEPGSPVLAVQLNNDPGVQHSGSSITVIACEKNPENRRKLELSLGEWIHCADPKAIVLGGGFAEYLDAIADITREFPTLYFLDSFGMADLNLDALRPILESRPRRKEVLMRLDHTMFARWAGWLEERPRTARATRTAARFAELIERFRVDSVLAKSLRGDDLDDVHHALMRGYVEAFMDRFEWVNLIPIRATFAGAPRYYLLHATDSEHGCACMNDVVSTTRDELFERSAQLERDRTGQGDFFAPNAFQAPRRASALELTDWVDAVLLEQGPMTLIRLRAELATYVGPEYREKHHKAAVRELLTAGMISCSTGSSIKDSSRLQKT